MLNKKRIGVFNTFVTMKPQYPSRLTKPLFIFAMLAPLLVLQGCDVKNPLLSYYGPNNAIVETIPLYAEFVVVDFDNIPAAVCFKRLEQRAVEMGYEWEFTDDEKFLLASKGRGILKSEVEHRLEVKMRASNTGTKVVISSYYRRLNRGSSNRTTSWEPALFLTPAASLAFAQAVDFALALQPSAISFEKIDPLHFWEWGAFQR